MLEICQTAGTMGTKIRHTYSYPSGNGHRLNELTGSIPQGAFGMGLGGHKFKNVGNMPNSWTDRDHIWHTYADASGKDVG